MRFFGYSSCSYCQAKRREEDHEFNTSVKLIRNENINFMGGQLSCSNSKFKTTSNQFSISISFTNPLRKTIYPQKSPKNLQSSPKRRYA